jgi:hypothetical protein
LLSYNPPQTGDWSEISSIHGRHRVVSPNTGDEKPGFPVPGYSQPRLHPGVEPRRMLLGRKSGDTLINSFSGEATLPESVVE